MSNNYTIELNKNDALIKLNQIVQTPDKINIIKYYNDSGEIDFLLAIGKDTGIGPEYYSMVQSHEEILVVNISNRPSDVSALIHKEKALCYCNPDNEYPSDRWFMIEDKPGNSQTPWIRNFIELTEPAIYRNLDDGFRWFFVNGVLKREDDFLTKDEVSSFLEQNIEYFQKPILEIVFDFPEDTIKEGNKYYLPYLNPTIIEKPTFSVSIKNYKNQDVTGEYIISLDSPEELTVVEDNKYMVWGRWTHDFSLTIKASKNLLVTSETFNIWFPEIIYYGKSTINSLGDLIIGVVNSKYIYHDLEYIDLTYTLDSNRSVLLLPGGFLKFNHIYDSNGLDYINDYTYISSYSYLGVSYQVYYKNDPVTINKFRQKFTYSNIIPDLPNSVDWFKEIGPDDYYTKEQVDELISGITIEDIINDYIVSTDKTWSSSKLNPIYTWALEKMDSDLSENFIIETSVSGQSYYSDVVSETTMTVTVRTKYSGELVDADLTPLGWSKSSTGVYTKTITGSEGSFIDSQQFSYTINDITLIKSSTRKNIIQINPSYYGLVSSNNGSAVISSQVISNLTRTTNNINTTTTINNNTPDVSYLWILTKNTADATQLGLSLFSDNITQNKSFISPMNSNIEMTGYKLYISDKSVASGSSYSNVNLIINI